LENKPKHVLLVIAKLAPLGDWATCEELKEFLGRRWYISPTGRKLKNREDDETPITLKCYKEAEHMALLTRGARLLAEAEA